MVKLCLYMATKNRLFSLDEEAIDYIEAIPKNKRSETIRESLKLHKKLNGIVINQPKPKEIVNSTPKKIPKMEVTFL